jgi:two-component system phosphate regulon sensor histidine kinase PhoR
MTLQEQNDRSGEIAVKDPPAPGTPSRRVGRKSGAEAADMRNGHQGEHAAQSLFGLEDGSDLFGLAAHKLNTPLASIRGFAATLLQRGDQLDEQTVQQFLQLILAQTDRLQGLVRDFLLLARINGGVDALDRPLRPRDLLAAMLEQRDGSGDGRVQLVGDLDVEVSGDAELISLALRPLLENSLSYGPRRGPVTITVTVASAGDRARWEVHDQGSWLSDAGLDELFRPFIRSDEPIERRGAGAGLGLTLARTYAQALRGSVGGRVDQHGTTFWLDLPTPVANGQTGG